MTSDRARQKRAAFQRKPLVPMWRAPGTVACRGADTALFFKRERAEGEVYADYLESEEAREWRAKALCARCPFKEECLERAMAEEKSGGRYGIRGEMTPEERTALAKKRSRKPRGPRGRPPRGKPAEEAAA